MWVGTAHQTQRFHEHPPVLDARLVRAHADVDDAHAERRAGIARGQCRSPSSCRGRRPGPRTACGAPDGRASRRRARSRRRRPVGDDVSTQDRAACHRTRQVVATVRDNRRRRLRPEPGVGRLRGRVLRRRHHRPRRRRHHVQRAATRTGSTCARVRSGTGHWALGTGAVTALRTPAPCTRAPRTTHRARRTAQRSCLDPRPVLSRR